MLAETDSRVKSIKVGRQSRAFPTSSSRISTAFTETQARTSYQWATCRIAT